MILDAELWQRYCGFLDLSVPEFMGIQNNLLMERLALLQRSPLGRHILGNHAPKTLEEFRRLVPITSYQDYAPFLLERHEDALPAKALLWQRTSGASGQYPFKWAPITQRMHEEMGTAVFSILILATARFKGDISFTENEKMLYALAPPPYATGCWGCRAAGSCPSTSCRRSISPGIWSSRSVWSKDCAAAWTLESTSYSACRASWWRSASR